MDEAGQVLVSTSHYPANQYNAGAYVVAVYRNLETRRHTAYAVRSGEVIAEGQGRSEFDAKYHMNNALRQHDAEIMASRKVAA